MGFSGGDPTALSSCSGRLGDLSVDLAGDAAHPARLADRAGGAAPDHVGELAETALAALGGSLVGASTLAAALSPGAAVAADQLVKATGGRR